MCFRPPTANKQTKKCPKCGTINAPTVKKCVECGTELPELTPPPGQPGGTAPAPPGKPGGLTPPKAPPPPPKAPPLPPKAPPAPPKAPPAPPKPPTGEDSK